MLNAYQELNYERAEAFAKEILASYAAYPLDELTQVHITLGMIKYGQNNHLESREQFQAALSLEPELSLDPTLVSPKILTFFNEIKAGQAAQNELVATEAEVRYIVLPDPRPAAALRSMLLPGWGQFYKGEQKKGILLAGLWSLSAGGTLVAHLSRQDAGRQYRRARDPEEIASRYDTYNQRNKLRNGLALAAAGIWAYSYFDALSNPIRLDASQGRASVDLLPAASYPYTQFRFSLSF